MRRSFGKQSGESVESVSCLGFRSGFKLVDENSIEKKIKSKKTGYMLRSIGKQSGESVPSVPVKKRRAAVGRICRKGRFKPGIETVQSVGTLGSTRRARTMKSLIFCQWKSYSANRS